MAETLPDTDPAGAAGTVAEADIQEDMLTPEVLNVAPEVPAVDGGKPEASAEAEPAPEPEKAPDAAAEPPPDKGTRDKAAVTDTPAWSPQRFADEAMIDPALVQHCKSEGEALKAVAARLRNNEYLMGRQAAELGELRKASQQVKPAAAAEKAADEQARVTLQGEQLEKWREWQEEDPVAAQTWLTEQTMLPRVKSMLSEVVDPLRKELAEAREAPRLAALQAEMDTFKTAHPDWEAKRPELVVVLEQFPDLPYEKAWSLVTMDAKRAAAVQELIRSRVPFDRAVRVVEAEQTHVESVRKKSDDAEAIATASGRARSASSAPMAAPPVRHGEDIPDEAFGPGGVL